MKKLLLSVIVAGIAAIQANAQSKTWDFSDTSKFPAGVISVTTTINGLTLIPGGSNLTISTTNLATFEDNYAPTQRLQFGGNSYSGSTNPTVGTTSMPTRRYLQFPVSDNAIIKFWARGGGAGRSVLISDNAGKVLSSTTFNGSSVTDIVIASYTYTGTPTNIIVSTGNGDNSVYKIEYIDNSTLAAGGSNASLKTRIISSGNRIFVSNLDSKHNSINVYTTGGSLVKTLKSASDTDFEVADKGVYIVNVISEKGSFSEKVIIR
ncbi:T9SS type A sorting domain-containing protein [Epilithonimonas sp.]|uniref:T9SS type A sorting domain-containing protein n=1 Tax=Epilithonimonas sp. TaxID=2894511 RepID=UPI0028A67A8E|nr:T9SS type A sorting domain-containing protein [Epilithonimonas sp.]